MCHPAKQFTQLSNIDQYCAGRFHRLPLGYLDILGQTALLQQIARIEYLVSAANRLFTAAAKNRR